MRRTLAKRSGCPNPFSSLLARCKHENSCYNDERSFYVGHCLCTLITPNGPPRDCRIGRMMTLNLMTGISERVQANVGRPMDSSEEQSPCEVVLQIRLETLLESLDSPYKLGRKSTTNTYRSRTRRGGARKECQSKVFSRCELKYDSLR